MYLNQLIRDSAMVDILQPEIEVRRRMCEGEDKAHGFSEEDLVSMRDEADEKFAIIQGIANAYKAQIRHNSDGRYLKLENVAPWRAIALVNNIFAAAKAGVRLADHDRTDPRAFVYEVNESDQEDDIPF